MVCHVFRIEGWRVVNNVLEIAMDNVVMVQVLYTRKYGF